MLILNLGVFLALLCLAVALSRHRPPQPPLVAVSFVGFTNSGNRVEALFALSNPPNAAISLHSVRAAISGQPSGAAKERGHFSWARRDPWGLAYAVTVDSTNEPLRIVFKLQQRAAGPRRIFERMRELFGKLTSKETEFFTGNTFFVTNETRADSRPH